MKMEETIVPEVISKLTPENCKEFLDMLYESRDKNSKFKYVVVSPSAHAIINDVIFNNENEYKARIEEIAGMKYTVSHLRNDIEVPQALLAPIDIAKIVAVYGNFEGIETTINDLFDSELMQWQKVEKEKQTS